LLICSLLTAYCLFLPAPLSAQPSQNPAIPDTTIAAETGPAPFGASLFQGQFGADQRIGLNPNYRIQPGDEIAVSIWGQVEAQQTLNVDNQGNIFLPGVGPVPVQGVHYARLTEQVQHHIRSRYKQNVHVYTNLMGTQPISVYVTGAVTSPGRFSGLASYSVLHYIEMAQGIDPQRGSFRQIDILRQAKGAAERVARIDLYDFLFEGELPHIQLYDGDTILVHEKGLSVTASGAVNNPAIFEFADATIESDALLKMARPLPEATHVLIRGTRRQTPLSEYINIQDLSHFVLRDGDLLEFQSGVVANQMLVYIEGQHRGSQTLVVPQDAGLLEVLRQIPVNPDLAHTEAVYLRRKSVARRQKVALDESLRRLESSVLSTGTMSQEETAIQAQQVQMVQSFINRARQVQPEGRMVLSTEAGIQNILLEDGDTIFIPKKSQVVLVNGEVLMPRAVVHQSNKSIDFYIRQAGGFTQRADDEQIVVMRVNGAALLDTEETDVVVHPGDEIMVLPKVPSNILQLSKDIADILYKIAITAVVPLRF
jgi:protein involved in polysaccharide export with SLBB domain